MKKQVLRNISNFSKSNQYRGSIHKLIPGGAHTYSKGDDQFPLLSPAAISHGKGAHLWDIDGNQFLDCNCLNSVYVRSPENFQATMQLLPDEMAQNKDLRCANNPPDGAFINKWSQKDNLTFCVNSPR